VPDFIDTLFIDRDINNWSLRIFTSYKNTRFILSNNNSRLSYVPNNPFGLGIGIATKKMIIDIGFNLKGNKQNITNRYDLKANMMLSKHIFDFYFQRYQGFNVENDSDEPEVFRDDFTSLSLGLKYTYLFNAGNYSVAASSSGLSRQKKAATSFGIGPYLFLRNQSADSTIIPAELQDNFNKEANIKKLFGIGAGIHGGFTAVFPLPYHFFLLLSVNPGIGLMYKNLETETINYTVSDPILYKLDMDGVFGYNGDRIYLTLRLEFNFFGTDLSYENKARFYSANAKLAFGYKLRERR
jgi:hypothetical protein